MSSWRLGLGATFAAAAAYSAYVYYHYHVALRRQREATAFKPKVEKKTLVALLKEAATEASRVVKTVEAGAKLGGAKGGEAEALKENVPHLIRAEMRDVDERLFAKHGTARGDVEAALAYYTRGPGRDREVVEGVKSVKRVLSKSMITKRRIVETIISMHQAQMEGMDGLIESVLNAADPSTPAFGQMLQAGSMRMASDHVAEELGLASAEELMKLAHTEGLKDAEFAAAVGSAVETWAHKVNAAVGEIMASKGMLPGGMGM